MTTPGCSDEEKPTPPAAGGRTLFLGTYTKGWACDPMIAGDCTSKGIYKATFDPATGVISTPTVAAETVNPSYLAISPNGKYLYAVNEVDDFKAGEKTGAVSAYAINDGNLTLLNQVSSQGADPCHISVTSSGGHVLVANYSGGNVVSYGVEADGKLKEGNMVQHTGMSTHMNQTAPHAHFIVQAKNNLVYVADLGTDKINIYKLDTATSKLTANDPPFAMLTPGSGPRHIAFHPSKDVVYSNNELSTSITVFTLDPAKGGLTAIQTLPSLQAGFMGGSDNAEIQVSPDGKYLYVSNRGPNNIGTFSIAADGKLTPINFPASGGNWPRDFKLDPTGAFILVGHQKSNDIAVFKIDPATGMLSQHGSKTTMSKPVNFVFVP